MKQFYLSIMIVLFTMPLGAASGNVEKMHSLKDGPVTTGSLLQLVLGLLLVLAVIALIAWLLRRLSGWNSTANGALKVVATLPIGQRERVVVIQAGEQQLLIGVTAGQVEMLHILEHPLPDSSATSPQNSKFARRLAAAIDREGDRQ